MAFTIDSIEFPPPYRLITRALVAIFCLLVGYYNWSHDRMPHPWHLLLYAFVACIAFVPDFVVQGTIAHPWVDHVLWACGWRV
ncbi:hypothetical protein NU195Hw_Modified_119t1 [Hortaea werneckii]